MTKGGESFGRCIKMSPVKYYYKFLSFNFFQLVNWKYTGEVDLIFSKCCSVSLLTCTESFRMRNVFSN